jgi:ceramide glucosyltransferase
MSWQTFFTVLPTALSAVFCSTTHLTFFSAMSARKPAEIPPAPPLVSILKPVAGRDEALIENLSSFADLDYPAYELLLGVASLDDPAVPVLQAFLAAHPSLPAQLIVTAPPRGAVANPKVAQLIALARAARGAVLVVSDANVRVRKSYLRSLVAALARPGVGLVSSVIVGAGGRTLAASIDSAEQGAHIAPSVVAAHRLGLWPITVGKSMAMWKSALAAVGGFESVASVLAEDDVLGQRFHAKGYGVDLCFEPVEHHGPGASWSATIDRHARWARLRRSITPLGFAFELWLSPLIVAAAIAIAGPSRLSIGVLAGALVLSWAGALLSLLCAGARDAFRLAALEPLRAATMFLCWCLGFTSRKIVWRGNAFTIAAGSALIPADEEPSVASVSSARISSI